MKHTASKGFTLIELAIVIVIIGLIIVGVMQGNELIKQATLRKHIKSVNDITLAVATFQTKYDGLPGDLKRAGQFFPSCVVNGNTVTGDGDGIIGRRAADGMHENWCVWMHLKNSGMYDAVKTKANTIFEPDSGNAEPASDMDFMTTAYPYSTSPVDAGFAFAIGFGHNWYYEFDGNEDPGNPNYLLRNKNYLWTTSGAFSGQDLQSIDAKLDDGKAATGRLTAMYQSKISVDAGGYLNYVYGQEDCLTTTGWTTACMITGLCAVTHSMGPPVGAADYSLMEGQGKGCALVYVLN